MCRTLYGCASAFATRPAAGKAAAAFEFAVSTMLEVGPALRIQLFGHLRASVDGVPFQLAAPRRSMPLLAYLILHRGAAVSREFLSFLLWPDDSEESARGKLRATLHDLVRVLPEAPDGHWITIEGTSIRWNPGTATSVTSTSLKPRSPIPIHWKKRSPSIPETC